MKKYWFYYYTEVVIEAENLDKAEDIFWEDIKKLEKVFPNVKEVSLENCEEWEEIKELEKIFSKIEEKGV